LKSREEVKPGSVGQPFAEKDAEIGYPVERLL